MLVFSIIARSSSSAGFSGIIEADETCQRESLKGVRVERGPKSKGCPRMGSPLRRSAERPAAAAPPLGGLHDARAEDDARSLELATPHPHRRRPWRFSPFPAATEPQECHREARHEASGAGWCRALPERGEWLQEPRGGTPTGALRGRQQEPQRLHPLARDATGGDTTRGACPRIANLVAWQRSASSSCRLFARSRVRHVDSSFRAMVNS